MLGGVHVVLVGAGAPSRFGAALAARCEALGAHVDHRELDPLGDEPEPFEGSAGVLVWDAAGAFGARDAAARAGLENLARTLSVEWARFGVRPVALHPGSATRPELAELAACLASWAGRLLLRLPVLPRGGGRLLVGR